VVKKAWSWTLLLPVCFNRVDRGNFIFNSTENPICHLLALLGAHHILNVSRIKVKLINSTV
jgi:hypothetical protein